MRLRAARRERRRSIWQRRTTGAETALFRSDDGARSRRRLRGGLPETFRPYINALVIDPHAPDTVAFGTDDGEVYLSRDAGERWERIAQAPPVRRMLPL